MAFTLFLGLAAGRRRIIIDECFQRVITAAAAAAAVADYAGLHWNDHSLTRRSLCS